MIRIPAALLLAAAFLALSAGARAHEHRAPHGGGLVEVGEEFAHVELVVDAQARTLKAYVLDGEAEASIRIAQKSLRLRLKNGDVLELKSFADPLTGERPGDSSEFSIHWVKPARLTRLQGAVESLVVHGERFRNLPFSLPLDGHAQR
jgi:hypothetical protein